MLVADHPALDFLNTVASPQGEPLDWISDGQAFLAWLRRSALLTEEELDRAERRFEKGELDEAAGEARALRSWLLGAISARKKGEAVDLAPVDAVLAHDWTRPVLRSGRWSRVRDLRSALALLGPLAEAAGDLMAFRSADRIRQCEGDGCTLWFLDVSRTNRRRWCSMTVCGNRAKVAAHRARHRGR